MTAGTLEVESPGGGVLVAIPPLRWDEGKVSLVLAVYFLADSFEHFFGDFDGVG
jgi:hypothetical protein